MGSGNAAVLLTEGTCMEEHFKWDQYYSLYHDIRLYCKCCLVRRNSLTLFNHPNKLNAKLLNPHSLGPEPPKTPKTPKP